jgi:hypothetical protein
MLRFWKKQQKIIIGIHGVGNKPPKRILKSWWERAIQEGLQRIGRPDLKFRFELVYWAHLLYSQPQQLQIKNKSHPLYVEDPYVPGRLRSAKTAPSRLRKKLLDFAEKILDKIFLSEHRLLNVDVISDFIIRNKFRDLDLYYHDTNIEGRRSGFRARAMIRRALAHTLNQHKRDDILLIAHSMGSIVAYDVLIHEAPNVKIHSLVTLGSPLGLAAIIKKILIELKKDFRVEKKAPTPENIQRAWYNLSDLNDHIAMNYNLADDFAKNTRGVGPQDVIVNNDYEFEGVRNHHKSYGYLRTAEMAEIIYKFLTERPPSFFEALKQRLKYFWRWKTPPEPR